MNLLLSVKLHVFVRRLRTLLSVSSQVAIADMTGKESSHGQANEDNAGIWKH